jgi:hypothetical protein
MLEIQVLALNRHKNVKLVNGIPIATSPCDNWISDGNTYIINKRYITKIPKFTSTQKDPILSQK